MSGNLYQDEIIKHANESEANFRVAIQAGLAFDELRNKLIREFFHALKVKMELDTNWEVDTSEVEKLPMKSAVITKFRKSDWIENVYIALQPQSGGVNEYVVGVLASKEGVGAELWQKIRDILNRELGEGKRDSWPWFQYLNENFRDFNNPKTLMELYRKVAMCDALATRINEIGMVADECLKNGSVHIAIDCDTP